MIEWTADRVSKLEKRQITLLRENATRLGKIDVVDLCNAELGRRKPTKTAQAVRFVENRTGQYVSEFHFVCPNGLGVITNSDGTRWTCTWVVDENNAKAAEKYGSIVALHSSKAEHSYAQGIVKAWRKSPREPQYSGDQVVKTTFGIDFLFEPTNVSVPWRGDATGEKGYAWSPIPI